MKTSKDLNLVIIGLGYVGLPLAIAFANKRPVKGFDINIKRINQLKKGYDINGELSETEIKKSKNLTFISKLDNLTENCFIITAPTPIDNQKKPDLYFLKKATESISKILKKNDLIIYESTVFPGCTEEVCVPILERSSNLKYNVDFFCGYSPERINPGDKDRNVSEITKITSGSNEEVAKIVDELYSEIVIAGTHMVSSIKVAEAAKVIENSQRDLNIALMNELSIIFDKIGIDTEEVLKAAETKWNFHKYRPGLVGGHCIGVDPYYLTYKSQELGYIPEIILSGRRLNDKMGSHVVNRLIKNMIKKNIEINNSKILIMGLTFKENCKDLRNSKVFDLIEELNDLNIVVEVFDPLVEHDDLDNINIVSQPRVNFYDALIIAVPHDQFKTYNGNDLRKFCVKNSVIFDLKYLLKNYEADMRL